jgi:hypothetical protein
MAFILIGKEEKGFEFLCLLVGMWFFLEIGRQK